LKEERGKPEFDPTYVFPELPSCNYTPTGLLEYIRLCNCLPSECEKAFQDLLDITFVIAKALCEHSSAEGEEYTKLECDGTVEDPTNLVFTAMATMKLPREYIERCMKKKELRVIFKRGLEGKVDFIVHYNINSNI
jgi:hypothetical protein